MNTKNKKILIVSCVVIALFFFAGSFIVIYMIAFGKQSSKSDDSIKKIESEAQEEDEISYSQISHCGLNREDFQDMIPEKIETASKLSQQKQEEHLREVVRIIRDNNIKGEEIVVKDKFKQKVNMIEKEIDQGIETGDYYILVKELVALTGDNHSAFLTPEESSAYTDFYTGPKSNLSAGISLVSCINPWSKKGAALITYVYEDGPAQKAGIKPFQLVTNINNKPTVKDGQLSLELGDEKVRSYTVLDYEGELKTYQIELEDVTTQHVYFEQFEEYYYFNIKSFTTTNIEKFKTLYENNASKNTKPLVIDLRFNTGGDVYALENLLDYFFKSGTKVGYRSSSIYSDEDMIVGMENPIQNRKIYIWTWYLTDSASQIFTGVMQEEGKAEAVGIELDGNVESISAVSVYVDNSKVVNSIRVFHPNSGKNWHKNGIPADIQIGDVVWGKFSPENDPYRKKTLEVMGK